MKLKFASLQIRIQHVAVFLLIRGLFLFFCFHLIELLFGRVLANICEALLRLCVNEYKKNDHPCLSFFFCFIFCFKDSSCLFF